MINRKVGQDLLHRRTWSRKALIVLICWLVLGFGVQAAAGISFDLQLPQIDGTILELSSLQGQKVFLDFGAMWCGACAAQKPHLQKIYENYPEAAVLWVNFQEDPEDVAAYMEANGYTFPVVFDTDGRVFEALGIAQIPTNFVLDEEGRVLYRISGSLSYESLKQVLGLH